MSRLRVGKLPNGQTAVVSDRGVGAAMEAGYQPTRESDAAEIVRRWNSFPDLLAALEGILKVANVRIDDPRIDQFDAARAAIAKAKGESNV